MKLAQIKAALAERGIQLTRSLGQNFLHDANQLNKIVAAAQLTKSDRVLEIGPGLGPLTARLLDQAGEVLAIEVDKRLVEVLQERFSASSPPLQLIHEDALAYLRREQTDWREWKLVANMPYSIASPLLVELASQGRGPARMVATLQLEVAKRIFAQTDAEDYGILTLLLQLDYAPHTWFKIPAGCFFPEPDVTSACVVLDRRAEPLLPAAHRKTFYKVVKRGFSERRKMMLKLLAQDWPRELLLEEYRKLSLSPEIRAEKVSLRQFARLAEALATKTTPADG